MAARAWGRVTVWGIGVLLLCGAALLGGIALWFGTPSGLEWLAHRAVAASGGKLALEGVQGSLYQRIAVRRLTLRDADWRLEMNQVAMAWRPRALLGRALHVDEFSVGELRAVRTGTPVAEPPPFPQTLRLPFAVTLSDARIGRMHVGDEVVAENLHLRVQSRAAAHTLEILGVDAFGVHASGSASVSADRPFATNGRLDLSASMDGKPLAATLTLGGNLRTLQLTARSAANGASATALARIRPFDQRVLEHASLDARDINLALWKNALPETRLNLTVAASMPEPGRLAGTVAAANALPGPLDTNRIPVKSAAFGYAGSGTRWTLSDIALDIGRAARVTGSGAADGAAGQLTLALANVKLDELHRKLQPLVVSGQVAIKGSAGEQTAIASLAGSGARLDLEARHAQQVITLSRGTLRANSARADFAGKVALAGRREYAFNATFANLDPAQFVTVPAGSLNGTVAAGGRLLPEWEADIRLAIDKSRLRGSPLAAQAAFLTSAAQLFSGKAHADYAGNRLDVNGSFGKPQDRLQWTVHAPNLAAVDASLAGTLRSHGTLSGSLKQPLIEFALEARQLRAGGFAVKTADAEGRLVADAQAPMSLAAHVTGLQTAAVVLDDLTVNAKGSRRQHDIAATSRGPQVQATLRGNGGLSDDWRWSGRLTTLETRGRVAVRLTAPASLGVGPGMLDISGLQGTAFNGRFGPARLQIAQGQLRSEGTFANVALQSLLALAPQTAIAAPNAAIGGKWQVTMDDAVNGEATVYLEQGDLALKSEPRLPFGLQQLRIQVDAKQNRLNATLQARSTTMGTASAAVQTRIERRDDNWIVAGNAPLTGNVALDMQSLLWLRALTPQLDRLGGRMQVNLTLGGTLGKPQMTGDLGADALLVRDFKSGLHLHDGTLRARLDGTKVQIVKFSIKAGDGVIDADGTADIGAGLRGLAIALRATRARILSSPLLSVVVSGATQVRFKDLNLALDGKLSIDEGRYDLGIERRPTLGDDVVVIDPGKPATAAKPLRVLLDVTVDLADRFVIRGQGLDAVLGGVLRTTTRNGNLYAAGTVHTVRGSFYAFGEPLEIARGRLAFAGPLNNPGLDLRAGRKIGNVEVGVEVSGTLQRPTVKLASDPPMSDSERLGWLVLGHDPQTAGAAELALLQAAALTMNRRQGTPLQKQIADKLGLDQFGVSRGTDGALGVLALGKRITDRLTVRLEQGIGGTAGSLLKFDYLLSQRWKLQGTAGAENAADILFTLRFD